MTKPFADVEQSQLDKSIEVFTMAAMGAYLVYIFITYSSLPEQIPSHFGPSGEPDTWSSKASIFILPAIALFTYILLTVINKYPQAFNYPVKITPENAAFHYEKARSLITRIKGAMTFVFIYISWRTIAIVNGKASGLGQWFLIAMLVLTFLPIILYFVEIAKAKRSSS